MKTTLLFLALLQYVSSSLAASCSADNCARAVTGTTNGLATQAAHKQDCSSFFAVTVTPGTTTITHTATITPATVTQTVTGAVVTQTVVVPVSETTTDATVDVTAATITDIVTVTLSTAIVTTTVATVVVQQSSPAKLKLRDGFEQRVAPRAVTVSPSSVPTYASACSGTARYSSACSCFGITHSTSTASTPSTTITVTATATATATSVVTATATVDATTTVIASITLTDLITATAILTDDVIATSIDAVTATTLSVPLPAPCGGVTPGDGSCGCEYTIECGVQFVDSGSGTDVSTTSSFAQCLQVCDNNFQCAALTYNIVTGQCVQLKGGYTTVLNPAYDSGPITLGSCHGVCSQDYKLR
ncbi:hypothetical protein MMC34_002917 [Xylographa carneopallida]|nr:hypothetical protein [Xylographa carneopallida]